MTVLRSRQVQPLPKTLNPPPPVADSDGGEVGPVTPEKAAEVASTFSSSSPSPLGSGRPAVRRSFRLAAMSGASPVETPAPSAAKTKRRSAGTGASGGPEVVAMASSGFDLNEDAMAVDDERPIVAVDEAGSPDLLELRLGSRLTRRRAGDGDAGDESGKRRRYSRKEKGKMVDLNASASEDEEAMEVEAEVCGGFVGAPIVIDDDEEEDRVWEQSIPQRSKTERVKDRFLETAMSFASQHARFDQSREGGGGGGDLLVDDARGGAVEVEDWPGPFSTARRILEDRQSKMNSKGAIGSKGKRSPKIEWVPKSKIESLPCRKPPPSLVELCIKTLCAYGEHITSLDYVPDALKSSLCGLLCDARKMDSHLLSLFFNGCPSEVRVKNCSDITEEQLKESIGLCDLSKLQVLQLDLSGHCVSDYIMCETVACSPNKLPLLVSVSLKYAYRLTNDGLAALVIAAPSLTSINLSGCSFLTSDGISALADTQGSVLKEIYLDGCVGIDAMLILPAMKKLKCLEVLSVADVPNVTDKFVCELVSVHGARMKTLNFARCRNLTDTSFTAVAENCKELLSLNLSYLQKLTDASLMCICNGCRNLQVLVLRQNSFSDVAVAAFVETVGPRLRELYLNNVKEVSNNTAISIANNCSSSLEILDLSFCRQLVDEAVGIIVDKCTSLRLLKLFGCDQVTQLFYGGHSNVDVKIIGEKLTPIFEDECKAQRLSPY